MTSPKHGGVTRWISDKFESIKFLSEQMPTVASFIKSELEGLRAPQSVHDLAEIFAKHPLNDLMKAAKDFLNECMPLRIAQENFSDMHDQPMAALVYPTLRQLVDSSEPKVVESVNKHVKRVASEYDVKIWAGIMWFSPEWIVLSARPRGKEPLSIQRANDLLGTGTPTFLILLERSGTHIRLAKITSGLVV